MDNVKYYEVEGAVFRKPAEKPMEVYFDGQGWTKYKGDDSRIYRMSHVLTLEEVKPYMDVPRPVAEKKGARS